jgi:predicted amidophosphoribosyltransferase
MTTYIVDPVTGEYEENRCMECQKDMSSSNNSLCLECELSYTLKEILSPYHCQECQHPIKKVGLCAGCEADFEKAMEEKWEYPDKDAEY